MIELVERHSAQLARGESGNAYFADEANFKQYIHRLVPMFTNTKPTSNNYVPLTTLLRTLRASQEDVFDKVMATFERSAVLELKRAWGQPVDEGEDAVLYEEKVVTVHEVLGDVKVGGLTTVGSSPAPPQTIPSRSRIPVRSPPPSPTTRRELPVTVKSPSTGFGMNVDEDMTMIGIPPVVAPPQAGSDKENLIEHGDTMVTKSVPGSPTRVHVRSRSQHSRTNSQPTSGPLSTMAKDLKKCTHPLCPLFFSVSHRVALPDIPVSQEIADQQKLLVNLIARLESKQMDSPGFHSLSRLCRKNHVDIQSDPPTDAEVFWQGGNKFNELLRALLEYLASTDFVVPPPPRFTLTLV